MTESRLQGWAKKALRHIKTVMKLILHYGTGRFCPVCSKTSRSFRSFGSPKRKDALCVHCGALERHRLLWLFLQEKTDLFNGKAKMMLHVAPESCLEQRFRKALGNHYLSADLSNPSAMVKMDITDIQYPDQSFDVIYCSHVLEHIPDDRRAMRELYRVLKDDGWAILLVPITTALTFEDPSIVNPEEREKLFGQSDHVRRYGTDYADRLREAGFNVEVTNAIDLVSREKAIEMGLTPDCGEIYYCTK